MGIIGLEELIKIETKKKVAWNLKNNNWERKGSGKIILVSEGSFCKIRAMCIPNVSKTEHPSGLPANGQDMKEGVGFNSFSATYHQL